MRTKRMDLLVLVAMIFAAGALIATDVAAEVRFDATVRTPVMSIRIGNAYVGYRPVGRIRPLPVRGPIRRAVRFDIQVAHRLAWYTGMPQGELLKYRRYGYSWHEIGQWLSVPGRVVRAAMSERGWNRFLHEGGYHAGYFGDRGRDRNKRDRHDRHGRGGDRDDYGYGR
ncbi:MAG: hypothetical protein PHQ19_04500 [Candidatus Krumholzibacteria bacterium]|nr:hypothetical protein [Candidatus Krumholzibacteria bacterium]